ncbi:hypothetical protein [Maricaulis alexandrii]|uniref:hypothetical protein n=1 Tax=Maricaulis alexandrii TaxID=2570354 RepID=UPI001109FEF8|nr:hypothetical protein [Maricaulis alexandrii]
MPAVEAHKRWDRNGVRQPVWCDSPVVALGERGLVPVTVFCPGARGEEALNAWEEALEESNLLTRPLTRRAEALRQRVANYDIPFLSLDVRTGRETALDVFIKMNTSASPLKDFDIVVAQLESATGESLHDMVHELVEAVPAVKDYGRVEDNILSIAALLMGRPPIKKTYLEAEFGDQFSSVWERLKHGVRHGTEFLRSEAIFNEKCVPSDVAIYLACALWADVPEHDFDRGGNARTLIRRALWRACYTSRYGKTSATRAFADYKTLSAQIAGAETGPCELFNEKLYPLPTIDEMVLAGWPGRKDRLPRAIMVTGLRRGGHDFADGAAITTTNFNGREFHHLYPVGILGGDRGDERVNRSLNCAVISWATKGLQSTCV